MRTGTSAPSLCERTRFTCRSCHRRTYRSAVTMSVPRGEVKLVVTPPIGSSGDRLA
jgi:hypothetical protein